MLSGQTARLAASAIRGSGLAGPFAVLGDVKLSRALADDGADVIAIADSLRDLERARGARVCAHQDALPIGIGSLAGIVAAGLGELAEIGAWQTRIAGWLVAVRNRGLVVLVDRGEPSELARRALCSGLTDLEQTRSGRTVVTCGRVRHWSG